MEPYHFPEAHRPSKPEGQAPRERAGQACGGGWAITEQQPMSAPGACPGGVAGAGMRAGPARESPRTGQAPAQPHRGPTALTGPSHHKAPPMPVLTQPCPRRLHAVFQLRRPRPGWLARPGPRHSGQSQDCWCGSPRLPWVTLCCSGRRGLGGRTFQQQRASGGSRLLEAPCADGIPRRRVPW